MYICIYVCFRIKNDEKVPRHQQLQQQQHFDTLTSMVRWSRCLMWWAVFESMWTLVCIIFRIFFFFSHRNRCFKFFNKNIYQTYLFRFDPVCLFFLSVFWSHFTRFPIDTFRWLFSFDECFDDLFFYSLYFWYSFNKALFFPFFNLYAVHNDFEVFNLISQHFFFFMDGMHGSQFRRVKLKY